jgi:3-dehydroquinate synthase
MSYQGITHGEAVAWGMIAANTIAVKRGILAPAIADRIERVVRSYEPMPVPHGIDERSILAATEHDKKNTGSARVMVLPRDVGDCVIVSDVTEQEVADAIRAVL